MTLIQAKWELHIAARNLAAHLASGGECGLACDYLDDMRRCLAQFDEAYNDNYEPPHRSGCICADCAGAELTADND